MISDGADTSDESLDEPLAALKARSIPVFTVGVGQEQFARDIQISRVETPRTILKGTSLAVDVVINHTGYAGQQVQLVVEDEGRRVSAQDVTLPRDGESATVRVNFTADGRRRAAVPVPCRAAGRTNRSRRTTCATRSSRSPRRARRCCTSRASRASK